jgi:hypothetical protein
VSGDESKSDEAKLSGGPKPARGGVVWMLAVYASFLAWVAHSYGLKNFLISIAGLITKFHKPS